MIRVGERLAQERKKKGLTIEEVAKATKIRPQYITALEKGEYEKLPSSAYAHGFVRNYASFLELPVKEILPIFRREFDEREFLGVLPESFTKPNTSPFIRFRLGTTGLVASLGIFFILIFVLFQYRSAFFAPSLSLSQPPENAIMHNQSVTVVGKTDPNNTVTVNDVPVFIDASGNFKKDISVFTGDVIITVKVVNNFGKKTILVRHIRVIP